MKGKKNGIVIMCVLLLVLLCVYFFTLKMSDDGKTQDTGDTDSSVTVIDRDATKVAGISFTNGGVEYSFSYNGSTWSYDADERFKADKGALDAIAQSMSDIVAIRYIEGAASDSAEYGLDAPAHIGKIKYTDGNSYIFFIGDYNRHKSAYYMSLNGREGVYMIDDELKTCFESKLLDLLDKDEMPSINADGVSKIEIVGPLGSSSLLKREIESLGEYEYIHTNSAGGEAAFDKEKAKAVIKTLILPKLEIVDYYAEESEMASFGLGDDEKITVKIYYTVNLTNTGEGSSGSTVSTKVEKTVTYILGEAEVSVEDEDAADTNTSTNTSTDSATDSATVTSTDIEDAKAETKKVNYVKLEGSDMIFKVNIEGASVMFE